MRNIVFHARQGLSTTVQADQRTLVRVGRGNGRPGDISVVHQRDGSIDVNISVDTLSSHHATLNVLSSGVYVEDLGSTNGTLLPIPVGDKRLCEGRMLLGPDVTVELDSQSWSLSDHATLRSAEDLVTFLRTRFRDTGCRIELVRSPIEKRDPQQAILPLVRGQGQVLVTWPQATIDLGTDKRMRMLVHSFNTLNQATVNDWKFTALSSERLETLQLARGAAPFEEPILLLGPSGSGKGVLAQDIHQHSFRAGGPFVHVNCTAISEHMFEREFFGHARGAFTGAVATSPGLIEAADGGTLFLDEIGDMPLALQSKLLTFLDKSQFIPVGTAKAQSANVRILAATNRDLPSMLGQGFRADLYYRLAPVTIHVAVPGPADLRAAVEQLAPEIAARNHVALLRNELEELANLAATGTYPGHFRDLKGMLARYLIRRETGKTIEQTWRSAVASMENGSSLETAPGEPPIPQAQRDAFVRHMENYARLQLARRALSVTELAHQIQQTSSAVYAWLKRRGLRPEDIGDTPALRDAIAAEVQALQPYLPLLQDLFPKQGSAS